VTEGVAEVAPPWQDDGFYATGIGVEVSNPALWDRMAEQLLVVWRAPA
jgi:hypothetical protein